MEIELLLDETGGVLSSSREATELDESALQLSKLTNRQHEVLAKLREFSPPKKTESACYLASSHSKETEDVGIPRSHLSSGRLEKIRKDIVDLQGELSIKRKTCEERKTEETDASKNLEEEVSLLKSLTRVSWGVDSGVVVDRNKKVVRQLLITPLPNFEFANYVWSRIG